MLLRSVRTIAIWLEYGAAGALAVMMLLTVADVMLRAIDPNWRIPGVVEIVVVVFACSVFLAFAATFALSQNIVVNIIDAILGPRTGRVLAIGSGVATASYLALLMVQGVVNAREAVQFNDQTMYLGLPTVLFWIPILLGIGVAFLAEILMLATTGSRTHDGGSDML